MILSAVNYTPPALDRAAMLLNTSRDDGVTWSLPDTLTPCESADFGAEDIVRNERYWLAYWLDSTRQLGFENGGGWCCFSANNGRSWYPSRQVEGSVTGHGYIGDVELRSGRARMYFYQKTGGMDITNYYYQVEGQIHTDSLPPAIFAATQLAPLLPGDTTVDLSVTAADNDSLWQMVMVLRRQGEVDSTVISLTRSASHSYQAQWCVPTDSADWLYYYRAEDMWENVAYYPPDGPASPWTFHVSPLSSSGDVIFHPSSFSLSVYPNPANSSVILSGTLPPDNKPVSLFVYDLLGREVSRLMIPHTGSNAFHVPWNLTDSDGRPLTTGLYFLVTLPHAVSTKLMVIR